MSTFAIIANSHALAAGTCGTAPSTMKLQASKAPAPIGKKIEAPPTTLRESRHTMAVFSFVAELNLHNLLTLGRNQTSLDLHSLNRRFPPRPAPRTQGHPRPELLSFADLWQLCNFAPRNQQGNHYAVTLETELPSLMFSSQIPDIVITTSDDNNANFHNNCVDLR